MALIVSLSGFIATKPPVAGESHRSLFMTICSLLKLEVPCLMLEIGQMRRREAGRCPLADCWPRQSHCFTQRVSKKGPNGTMILDEQIL